MWLTALTAIFVAFVSFQAFVNHRVANGPPHIIFILADDMGWNDIGYHNPDIKTPNMDALSLSGIRLNQSYMQQLCSPSRSAIMTGYYPFRTGLQHRVIWRLCPIGLPLQFTILPEMLRALGYETHMVGKWHLGYCHRNYTPLYRGFDSFMGSFTGAVTYFNHYFTGSRTIDFQNGTEILLDYQGVHSSVAFLNQVEHILNRRSTDKPLFLYLPFPLPHEPLEVQDKYLGLYPEMSDPTGVNRRIFSAMISSLDDDVGQVVELLKKFDVYKNSVIIFSSDNGGQVNNGGNNFPLRGLKNSLYEGGCRVPGFIHSPLLKSTGYTYNGLIHAVDWFATIIGLAGGQAGPEVDGKDLWDSITQNEPSPRTDFIYNIDNYNPVNFTGAIRVGDWKLIVGIAGQPNGTYAPDNITYKYVAYKNGDDLLRFPDEPWFRLFNIRDDPYEFNDLAEVLPQKVEELYETLKKYKADAVQPLWRPSSVNTTGIQVAKPGWCDPITNVARK